MEGQQVDEDVRSVLAERLCSWIFPEGPTGGSELDRSGRGWSMGRAEAQRRVARLPPRTLAEAVQFTARGTHPAVEGLVVALIASWCADCGGEVRFDLSDEASDALDLGSVLVLADILSAVAEASDYPISGYPSWDAARRDLDSAHDALWSDQFRFLGPTRVPPGGMLYADPAVIRGFRVLSLGALVKMRFSPGKVGTPMTREVFAYLDEHLDQHDAIIRAAKERSTLDPDVLDPVLASHVAVLSEGAL